MKKLFFLLLPALIMSCGGVEQHRASIEALATGWDAATAAVTELGNNIATDLSNYGKVASEVSFDEATTAKLTPEQITEWGNARQNFAESLQGYAPLRTEITEFSKVWSEQAVKVQELQDGLAGGKLEGDVAGKVAELNTLVTQANEKVTAWQAAYGDAKAKAESGLNSLRETYAAIAANIPAK